MYFIFGFIFVILIFFFCLNHWRKKKIIQKICCMCMEEKCALLDDLIAPFGYSYLLPQDIFTSRMDAWQRDFGYCALYDKAAPYLNMVFDSLPVYFDYQGRTWLIEFWKGQYGINTGCEIGIYHADSIIEESELKRTLFQCADDSEMPKLSLVFTKNEQCIAKLCGRHWWLTAFKLGCFSNPAVLSMHVCLTLQSCEMAEAFAEGLIRAGYNCCEIRVCHQTVTFIFDASCHKCGCWCRLQRRFAQFCNRFWCKVFLSVTKPFKLSVDRVLYLYYYLPFAFRKMFRIRKYKKHGRKKYRRCHKNC
ncbi:MAG: DUF4474 domain-containing protein [Lachnospiraceae bacterium]|nr:DUF4474 domain-containing protein [Lachnospiraceae bacterium]